MQGQRRHRYPSALMLGGILLCGLLPGACGEFAYKVGGQAEDMQTAQRDCGNGITDASAYKSCMAKKGWTVSDWNDSALLASTSVVSDNRAVVRSAEAGPSLPLAAPSVPASSAPPAASATPTLPASPPPDPKDRFRVGSWWKAGGSEDGLNADVDACVGRLGEEHRPDQPPRTVTRALLACLREKGWHGVKAGTAER